MKREVFHHRVSVQTQGGPTRVVLCVTLGHGPCVLTHRLAFENLIHGGRLWCSASVSSKEIQRHKVRPHTGVLPCMAGQECCEGCHWPFTQRKTYLKSVCTASRARTALQEKTCRDPSPGTDGTSPFAVSPAGAEAGSVLSRHAGRSTWPPYLATRHAPEVKTQGPRAPSLCWLVSVG